MVPRIYGPARVRRGNWIGFTAGNFIAIESRCGVAFDEKQRREIETTLNDYVAAQDMEWDSPRPNQLRPILKRLSGATSAFPARWRELETGKLEFAGHVLNRLENLFSALQRMNVDQVTAWAKDSGVRQLEINPRDAPEFGAWLSDTLRRAEFLERLLSAVGAQLPKDRGGRDTGKGWFLMLVYGLADVFVAAGKSPVVAYDHKTDSYPMTGFLGLVHEVQNLLPERYRYIGTSLGKQVQELLAARRPAPPRSETAQRVLAAMLDPEGRKARAKARRNKPRA